MKEFVEELWQARDTLGPDSLSQPELKKAILDTIDLLDTGKVRALSMENGTPVINEWVKKAILIYIQTTSCYPTNAGVLRYYDKIPMKLDGWDESRFKNAGITVLPGSVVRKGSFIGTQQAHALFCRHWRLFRARHQGRLVGAYRSLRSNWRRLHHRES